MSETVLHGASEWRAAHAALTRLARQRAGLDFEEGKWLLGAQRANVPARLGYGSFFEYIERLFGYSPRLTHDKLRVAQALEGLPTVARALRDGVVTWSSVRELTRVATPETEHAWLGAAAGCTAHEVERLVSGHRPGDLPDGSRSATAVRHSLRFDVSGEVLATFREALAKLRREAGDSLDDDAALFLMARQVLEGPADDGRASYQVAMTLCEACQRAMQIGRGEAVEVSPEMAATARCDAQVLPRAHVGKVAGAEVGQHAHAGQSGGTHGGQHTHAGESGGTHGGQHVEAGETGDVDALEPGRPLKATQTVPPAVRRAVLRRDQQRCQVPGCRHATFVDVHHIRAREDGGAHEPKNLLTLCSAHHRACHHGALSIEGCAPGALRFQHADGSDYGDAMSPHSADSHAQAFRALRKLGFGERETRVALRQSATHVGQGSELEALLRHALRLLTASGRAKAS